MKVYEYLAAGLPVVATPLRGLEEIAGVTVADGVEATVAALERALAGDSPDRRRARSESVRHHSWDSRLAEIAEALRR
jgi:glycosyltransferase involved in cell wall biosynthesis